MTARHDPLQLQALLSGAARQSNKHERHNKTNHEIRFLDNISVALTTGQRGEVSAAALDKLQGAPTLVLAKNDTPTDEERQAVAKLLREIIGSHAEMERLVLVFTRCQANIQKRLKKMLESVNSFSNLLSERPRDLQKRNSNPIEKELPDSDHYRKSVYAPAGGIEPQFDRMMHDLLENLRLITKTGIDSIASDSEVSVDKLVRRYILIAEAAAVLRKCSLLRDFGTDRTLPLLQRQEVEKLKRRLAKTCQYFQGMQSMFATAKRLFPKDIKHRWVTNGGTGSSVQLANTCMDVIPREQARSGPLKLPEHIKANWPAGKTIETRVHAEIRIVLDFLESLNKSNESVLYPIGCSKRSCLCCYLWIQECNLVFNEQFLTSGSHGKPYPAWALPRAGQLNNLANINRTVIGQVSRRLTHTRASKTHHRQPSDEYRSSGSDDSESERVLPLWAFNEATEGWRLNSDISRRE